jgi:iron complex transport system substrate-binding protein
VSAFINARFDKIEALEPDLILGFSDLQADIASELIRRGYPVMVFNQRSVAEILQMIRIVGALVGRGERAHDLVAKLEEGLGRIAAGAALFSYRPRVFFEEWDVPLISGIQWVEELVEIAGGTPIFSELRHAKLAKDRTVAPEEVVRRNPEVIVASWCGKAVKKERIAGRPGWNDVAAVRDGHIYEIKSAVILQPGPASLTEGVSQLHEIFKSAVVGQAREPEEFVPRQNDSSH